MYSHTWEDHLASLAVVFDRLVEAKLTLNLSKCEFGKASVTYLGKQVWHGQARPVDAKVSAMLSFPIPATRCDLPDCAVQLFLLCSLRNMNMPVMLRNLFSAVLLFQQHLTSLFPSNEKRTPVLLELCCWKMVRMT